MIRFPANVDDALGHEGEFRAGGTDLQERRHLGISSGALVDLRDIADLDRIEAGPTGGLRIGAKVPMAVLATDSRISAGYPGLARAAGSLATPQIREVGTLAGNLLQRSRCWYYRNPHARCLKNGGTACLARTGDHLLHACFERSACVAVHPSTLGMVALAYEAMLRIGGAPHRSVEALYGDGADPRREHTLEAGALLTHVDLPPALPQEQAAYFRAISRSRSEWPLVEAIVRLWIEADRVKAARVAVGGVAAVPLRLRRVEEALTGKPPDDASFGAAAKLASAGASPLEGTRYKVGLLEATVLETLERAARATPSPGLPSVTTDPSGPGDE